MRPSMVFDSPGWADDEGDAHPTSPPSALARWGGSGGSGQTATARHAAASTARGSVGAVAKGKAGAKGRSIFASGAAGPRAEAKGQGGASAKGGGSGRHACDHEGRKGGARTSAAGDIAAAAGASATQKRKRKRRDKHHESGSGDAAAATGAAAKARAAARASKAATAASPAAPTAAPTRTDRGHEAAAEDSTHSAAADGATASGKKRKKKKRKLVNEPAAITAVVPAPVAAAPSKKAKPPQAASAAAAAPQPALAAVRPSKASKAVRRLQGARFRMLNEKLYTTTGEEALSLFSESPELFDAYHEGFASQVEKWPVNPVDNAIAWIRARDASLVVADLGCGEARIAATVPNKVHSFDLVAANDSVVACDIANVPLPDKSVDIAVFCLALMGTNYADYLREARRILRKRGHLLAYEVVSRIESLDAFVASVERLGFACKGRDETNPMFVELWFARAAPAPDGAAGAAVPLKPCIYKRR